MHARKPKESRPPAKMAGCCVGFKSGKVNGDTLSDWAVWSAVDQSSQQIGIERFGAHDLRWTCAKLCRKNDGDREQIKFLLEHSSIETTERYLGRIRRSRRQ